MNPDLKDSLLNLMVQIRKSSDFRDELGTKLGNEEWLILFSLFLIVCELGSNEKVIAYKELSQVLQTHDEIIGLANGKEINIRLFKDTVAEESEVSGEALDILLILAGNLNVCQSLVSNKLVYNLITKVAEKHPEHLSKIIKILDAISAHGKGVWETESAEIARIKPISLLSESKLHLLINTS